MQRDIPSTQRAGVSRRPGDSSDVVFERLIEGIVEGMFPLGEPLRESRLAADWALSRTPVREAVRRLSAMGLVELRPNQRPLVRRLQPRDVTDLYAVREALELLALDLSWERISAARVEILLHSAERLSVRATPKNWRMRAVGLDRNLHGLWTSSCGNPWLEATLERYQPFIRIVQKLVARDTESAARSLEEHIAILDGLRCGDHARTRRKLRIHLRSAALMAAKLIDTPGG